MMIYQKDSEQIMSAQPRQVDPFETDNLLLSDHATFPPKESADKTPAHVKSLMRLRKASRLGISRTCLGHFSFTLILALSCKTTGIFHRPPEYNPAFYHSISSTFTVSSIASSADFSIADLCLNTSRVCYWFD